MKRNIDNRICRKEVFIKFVGKAHMWCKTYWNDRGEQKQEWSLIKPETTRPEK